MFLSVDARKLYFAPGIFNLLERHLKKIPLPALLQAEFSNYGRNPPGLRLFDGRIPPGLFIRVIPCILVVAEKYGPKSKNLTESLKQ